MTKVAPKISFGCHKGKRLDQVPTSYLKWLYGQRWLRYSRYDCYASVHQYIVDNADKLGIQVGHKIETHVDDFVVIQTNSDKDKIADFKT